MERLEKLLHLREMRETKSGGSASQPNGKTLDSDGKMERVIFSLDVGLSIFLLVSGGTSSLN
ncbi:hypothetical protein [Polycladomyces abyssicola]|uniref:hypothetical protein n=1 Tax=Polycladomyces abyssicola TaxID=1125966 RepID=UPI001BB2DC4D|nr:hypothetical protein [Polycladomyces abyssicola]